MSIEHAKWVHVRKVLAGVRDVGWPDPVAIAHEGNVVKAWYWAEVWKVGERRMVELSR
jgi:hypothetical protein